MTKNPMLTSKAIGAMLGAAYGDALGWPNERISKSNVIKKNQGQLYELKKWARRSGGRFFPYEEIIEVGEYSDDTQLILCISRSLQKDEDWWKYFTSVELPFWSVYERGGGGATKRAVDSWLDKLPPWSLKRKFQDVQRYFGAGGNGVAMRILPHILRLHEKDFSEIATSIFLDGIATHGHPRALLGALAYGFALWNALKKEKRLAYGELIEEMFEKEKVWSEIPSQASVPSEWLIQAEKCLPDYSSQWKAIKVEFLAYLETCRVEISKGALSFDEDALEKFQCFDPYVGGSGTAAALASIYLASRHAADPVHGVVKAAFAIGADTDTIASMTGGLLGCISGSDWLMSVKNNIQDAPYIERTALSLINRKVEKIGSVDNLRKTLIRNWVEDLTGVTVSDDILLPDRRKAKLVDHQDFVGQSGKFKVEFIKLITEDGQKICINKISKGSFGKKKNQNNEQENSALPFSRIKEFGFRIPVGSFERAFWFYHDCLGLTVKKKSSDAVVFDQGLVLVPLSYAKNLLKGFQLRAMIYVQVTNINECLNLIQSKNIHIVSPLAQWEQTGMLFFRAMDPDGNIVEIFSEPRKKMGQPSTF